MNIFVVDDETPITDSLCGFLKQMGHSCRPIQSAAEALVLMAREPVDLVVSDYKMPVMNGIDLLKIICKLYPLTDVIILTGFADVENAIEAVNSGAYAFFRKPLDVEDFKKTIMQIANERNGLAKSNGKPEELTKEYRKLRAAYEGLDKKVRQLLSGENQNG